MSGGGGDGRKTTSPEGRIAQEHRRLDALFSGVCTLLGEGSAPEARDAVGHLEEALETHFQQEDALYFPTLRSLRPEQEASLRALSREHEAFRGRVRELTVRLRSESPTALRPVVEQLASDFAEHEAAEEELLRALT